MFKTLVTLFLLLGLFLPIPAPAGTVEADETSIRVLLVDLVADAAFESFRL